MKVKLWTATKTRPKLRGLMILQRLSGQTFQAFKHWAKDLAWKRSSSPVYLA